MAIQAGTSKVGSKSGPLTRNESPTISTVSTDTEFSALQSGAISAQGILKSPLLQANSIRVDRGGTLIVPGSKSHRVSFADEIGGSPRPIAQIHRVESLKSFNFGNRFVDGENSCVCTIS
jgi:hypothetical protein